MEENVKKLYGILRKVCSYGTREPECVRALMEYVTGTNEWKYEEGLSFYEFILRKYLDDEEKLERMLAVSGLSHKYRSIGTISERRKKYLDSLGIYTGDIESFRKQEEPILRYIANSLLLDLQNNGLPKLIESWKIKMAENLEPLPEAQSSTVQPEVHISNDVSVSPTINNAITNDNNITVKVNLIHSANSISSMPTNSPASSREKRLNRLLTNRIWRILILLICLLVVVLFCGFLLSKNRLFLANNIFISDERITLRPGEIYEIKTAIPQVESQNVRPSFTSSDPSIAKVSEKGIIIAQNNSGVCEIVIQAENNNAAKIHVSVNAPEEKMSVPEIGDNGKYISGVSLNTRVRNTRITDSDWEDVAYAAVGDIVEFLIEYRTLNDKNLNDVVIRDILPQYMEYIPGSIRFYDSAHENGIYLEEDTITAEGIRLEPYQAKTKMSFRFAAKIINIDSDSTPVLLVNEAQIWDETKKETLLNDYTHIEAHFWGPERPTYTMATPADHAVFNSIIDNAVVGDERDFVRIAEKSEDGSSTYSNEVIMEAGKQYEVYIYFHNNASATYNESKYNNVGISWNTRLSCDFPDELEAGQRAAIVGRITSTNTEPRMIWDAANIVASQKMTLHYMPTTARIYSDSKWPMNGAGLSTNLFSPKGTFLGLNELNGTIPGCDEYSGYVIYTIQTYAVEDTK